VFAAGVAPAGVFGHQRGLEARDGRLDALQVFAVDAVGGAEAQAHAVQAERVVSPGAQQGVHRRAAFMEVVLGMRLDEAHGRALRGQLIVVHGPETDPGARRNRPQWYTS